MLQQGPYLVVVGGSYTGDRGGPGEDRPTAQLRKETLGATHSGPKAVSERQGYGFRGIAPAFRHDHGQDWGGPSECRPRKPHSGTGFQGSE